MYRKSNNPLGIPLERLAYSNSHIAALLCRRKSAVTINKYVVKAIAVDTFLNNRDGPLQNRYEYR